MKFRVIEQNNLFYVQKRTGLLFKSWETLTKEGLPLDYDHDWEDAEPISFNNLEEAIAFMETIAYPPEPDNPPKIKAWI